MVVLMIVNGCRSGVEATRRRVGRIGTLQNISPRAGPRIALVLLVYLELEHQPHHEKHDSQDGDRQGFPISPFKEGLGVGDA
jgi:hypothetical protein